MRYYHRLGLVIFLVLTLIVSTVTLIGDDKEEKPNDEEIYTDEEDPDDGDVDTDEENLYEGNESTKEDNPDEGNVSTKEDNPDEGNVSTKEDNPDEGNESTKEENPNENYTIIYNADVSYIRSEGKKNIMGMVSLLNGLDQIGIFWNDKITNTVNFSLVNTENELIISDKPLITNATDTRYFSVCFDNENNIIICTVEDTPTTINEILVENNLKIYKFDIDGSFISNTSFLITDPQISRDESIFKIMIGPPKLISDEFDNVHLTWTDMGQFCSNGSYQDCWTYDIHYMKLNENGKTIINDTALSYYDSNIDMDSSILIDNRNNLHVVWQSRIGGESGHRETKYLTIYNHDNKLMECQIKNISTGEPKYFYMNDNNIFLICSGFINDIWKYQIFTMNDNSSFEGVDIPTTSIFPLLVGEIINFHSWESDPCHSNNITFFHSTYAIVNDSIVIMNKTVVIINNKTGQHGPILMSLYFLISSEGEIYYSYQLEFDGLSQIFMFSLQKNNTSIFEYIQIF